LFPGFKSLGNLPGKIVESLSSNVVHIANGYDETIHVTCTSEGSSESSEFYIQPGEVKKHTTSGWTDSKTVNIKVEVNGCHLGTENIASNRSIIIDGIGRILYAMYQRWYEGGNSSIWTCEDGYDHYPD
jgi:hypothetical protein